MTHILKAAPLPFEPRFGTAVVVDLDGEFCAASLREWRRISGDHVEGEVLLHFLEHAPAPRKAGDERDSHHPSSSGSDRKPDQWLPFHLVQLPAKFEFGPKVWIEKKARDAHLTGAKLQPLFDPTERRKARAPTLQHAGTALNLLVSQANATATTEGSVADAADGKSWHEITNKVTQAFLTALLLNDDPGATTQYMMNGHMYTATLGMDAEAHGGMVMQQNKTHHNHAKRAVRVRQESLREQ